MHIAPFLVRVGCGACNASGNVGRKACPDCYGYGSYIVDLARDVGDDPGSFLDRYTESREHFLPEAGVDATDYAVERGWTWWDLSEGAPAWLVLPEGPSRLDFEDERVAGPGLAKTWSSAPWVVRRTA